MNRKEKPLPGEMGGTPPIGELLRRFRKEREWSLIDIAYNAKCSSSHLSNVEAGRAKLSKIILESYEECLEFKHHQIGAFFLLLHTGIIPVDSLFWDVPRCDLDNAVKIVEPLYCLPELLEPIAVFIRNVGCGLSGYLESYQLQIINELERHHRPSLVEFRLRTLSRKQFGGDS